MKKIITSLLALAVFASVLSFALAEEISVNEEAQKSLEENVSGFDVFKARVGLWFTLNKEKRVEKELKLAGMLLNRARIQAKKNNTKAMEQMLEEHNRIMERVKNRVEEMNKKNVSSEKLRGIDRAIEVHELRIEKFNEVLQNENISEQRKENIAKMLENSQKSVDVLRQLKEVREERKEIRERIRNETREEIEQVSRQIREQDRKRIEEIRNITRV